MGLITKEMKIINSDFLSSDNSGIPFIMNGKSVEIGLKIWKENILDEPYYFVLPNRNEIKNAVNNSLNSENIKSLSIYNRIEEIIEISSKIEKYEENISRIISLETGKSLEQSREEVLSAEKIMENSWALISSSDMNSRDGPISFVSDSNNIINQVKIENGISIVFPSFTSPFFTTISSIIRSIISGLPVIVRPSSYSMISSLSAVSLFSDSSLINDISFIPIRGLTNMDLFDNEDFTYYFYGKKINYKNLFKILSGKFISNCTGRVSVILCNLPENVDLISNSIAKLSLKHSGQACGSISWLISLESIKNEIVESIADRFSQSLVGNPLEGKEVGPLKNKEVADRSTKLINDAIYKGGTLLTGGLTNGRYIEPTLIDNVTKNSEILWTDIEAPVLASTSVSSCSEAISIAKMMSGASAVIVFGSDNIINKIGKTKKGIIIKGSNNIENILNSICYTSGDPINEIPKSPFPGRLGFDKSLIIY
ncbi:NAD-dependent aldehyde dehydrogenase [Caldisphaera lagunensis DSM 15908]|uniref:NAD-dependent aldehyde dehydrogenase n=1 Tax=Caldisphaera lagunensis (strain DSM 15908 / JCM 11604 / ANMR 0165 / IC-154) TaxID=1056495 RepID=L0A989_CALLD|nr:aldehyde dehydrogenase family protein [Caldisphaera lagunensis]AFZ69989.1 NAD-dependent aldehyde dehydrogenase [Caldisphaera lagunensis DSM 15908]